MKNQMRIEVLTFFRFIAALVVVIFHFDNELIAAEGFLVSGPEMVTFFFVLSGFVLAVSAGAVSSLGEGLYFYWCRIARIAPLFYFAAFFYVAVKAANGEIVSLKQLLLHLSFAQAWVPSYGLVVNAPGWSLSAEMFFYAAFPLVYWLLAERLSLKRSLFLVLVFWLLSALVSGLLLNFGEPSRKLNQFILYFPLLHLCSFALGVWGGVFYKQHPQYLALKARHLLLTVVFAVLVLEAMPKLAASLPFALPSGTNLHAAMFLVVVMVAAYSRSEYLSIFSNKFLMLLGNSSYGVYILQYPVYLVFYYGFWGHKPASSLPVFCLYLFTLTAISMALYVALEKPANGWLRAYGKNFALQRRAQNSI